MKRYFAYCTQLTARFPQNGKVYVETLSRNGKLYVNDQVIPPNLRQPLKPGDEIAIVASHKVQYVWIAFLIYFV
jgi:molybdopterin converting factor small subunit